ncbi:MAG: hypothetical protein IPL49_05045 [Saprospirales bacterium]|nr:hypothetical protein [Saprospirales bacterium]
MHNEASYFLTFSNSLLVQGTPCQSGLCAFMQLGSAQSIVYIQSGITSTKNSAPFDMDNNHAKGIFFGTKTIHQHN